MPDPLPEATFEKTLESVSVTYPDERNKRPPPWAPRNAFGRVKFQWGAGGRVQRVQKRARTLPFATLPYKAQLTKLADP